MKRSLIEIDYLTKSEKLEDGKLFGAYERLLFGCERGTFFYTFKNINDIIIALSKTVQMHKK